MNFFENILTFVNTAFIYLFFFFTAVKIVQLWIVSNTSSKDKKQLSMIDLKTYMGTDNMIPVSVIVPVYNNEKIIVDSIKHLLALDYKHKEVIIINDGSADNSHLHIINHFALEEIEYSFKQSIRTKSIQRVFYNAEYPNLIYVVKRHGGVADSLNCGINVSQYPVYTCVKPGAHIENDTLLRLSYEFFKDSGVIASGGVVRGKSELTSSDKGKISYIQGMQVFEFAQILSCDFLSREACYPLFTQYGSFTLFQKQLAVNCGGYRSDADNAHYDMMIRIHQLMSKNKRVYKIAVKGDIVYQVPSVKSLKELLNRNIYCQTGIINALFASRRTLFNFPEYGKFGIILQPYQWLLNVVYVLLEGLFYLTLPLAVVFGFMPLDSALYFIAAYLLLHIFISISGIVADQKSNENSISPTKCGVVFLFCVMGVLGYRQLTVVSRCLGIFKYKKKN